MNIRIVVLSLFLSIFSFACSKSDSDACKDKNCGSNGKCVDGECVCDAGYFYNATTGLCEPNDPCIGIDCGANGDCVNGVCVCDAGFVVNPATGKCEAVNPCAGIDCVNGVCNAGICNCNVGYEKDVNGKCTVEQRAKFISNYNASENCIFTGAATSMVSITVKSGQVNKVNITNISGFAVTFEGTVNATDNILIVKQNVDIAGTIYEVEGNLKLKSNGTIDYNYTAKDNLALVSCVGTMTKK